MMQSPNTPAPDALIGNVSAKKLTTNEQAIPVPYFGGRKWLSLIQAQTKVYSVRSSAVVQRVGKTRQVTGYDYFGSLIGVTSCCLNDYIEGIEVAGKVVWSGTISRDEEHPHHSGDIEVTGVGTFRYYWGTPDQPADDLIFQHDEELDLPFIQVGTEREYHPHYLDQSYMVVKDLYFGNNNSTPPTIRVLVERSARFDGMPEDRTREGTNPVTMIAEVIGNEFYGLGAPELIHVGSAAAVAAAVRRDTPVAVPLDAEHIAAMGFVSASLERQQSAQAFFSQLLETYDGWIRPIEDQLYFGRFPHDGIVPDDLPELSYHDFIEGKRPKFEPSDDDDIITEVNIVHTDRDDNMEKASTPVPNPAARRRLGYKKSRTFQRPFFCTKYQARDQGNQLARHYSRDEEACAVSARREKLTTLRAGDLFVLVDAPSESSQVVRIVQRTDPAVGGEVPLSLVLERGLAPLAFVAPSNPTPILPDPDLVAIEHARVFQLPSAFADLGPAPAVAILAERPGAHVAGYSAHFSTEDVTYDELAIDGRWALRGTIAAGADDEDDSFTVNASGLDIARLAAQSDAARDDDTLLLFIGFEICSIGNVVALGGGQYTVSVLRGRRGSAAAAHAMSAEVFIMPRAEIGLVQHADFPRSIETRHFKLATYTAGPSGGEKQELADALYIEFEFDDTNVTAPGTLAAVARAEAIFLSWTYPAPPEDTTIIATDIWEQNAAGTPDPLVTPPTWSIRGNGFNRGGLAAGTTKYYYALNRDTIGGRSAIQGPVNATALAAATGPAGTPGINGINGTNGLDGPGVPFRGNYSGAVAYYYIAGLRRDAVFHAGQYWATNNAAKNGLTTWGTPGASADWTSYGATYSAVATALLLAEDATIVKTITIGTSGGDHGLVQSANYVTSGGTAGWAIKDDGDVVFNSGVFRGTLEVGTGDNKFNKPVAGATTFGNTSAGHVALENFAASIGRIAAKYSTTALVAAQIADVGSGDIVGLLSVWSKNASTSLVIAGSVSPSVAPVITWGSDTNLYRSASNRLKTDDDFEVAGDILAGDDIIFSSSQKFRFDGAGSLIAYMQESYGINIWGDDTHPVHIRGGSLIRGSSAGTNYGGGNIWGFSVQFDPGSTLPNTFEAAQETGTDGNTYLKIKGPGGTTCWLRKFTALP